MKELWEIIKDHPIWSKVTSQLIGYSIIALFGIVFAFINFSSITDFLVQEWVIHMWGLILIALIPVTTFIGGKKIIISPKNKPRKPITTEQDWKAYRSDLVFDVLCQWEYFDNSINTGRLILLCPECKRELETKTNPYNGNLACMQCINCDYKINSIQSITLKGFKSKIIREIEGRIRNGEYKRTSQPTPGCVPKNFDKQLTQKKRESRW